MLLKGFIYIVIIFITSLLTFVAIIFTFLKRKNKKLFLTWLTIFLSSFILTIALTIYTGYKILGKSVQSIKNNIPESDNGLHYGGPKTYRYWAGSEVPADTKVINGQYWASGHFTKEYIMYLEVETEWVKYFAKDNNLQPAIGKVEIAKDAPKWFKPPQSFQVWLGNQGSMYFIDTLTSHMFIFERQL